MSYPDRVTYDFSQPEGQHRTAVPVDDAWVLANKQNTLLLSADKTMITAGDPPADAATITVQLRTPILTDGSYDSVAVGGDVAVLVDGAAVTVTLDGTGAGSFQVDSVEVGTFDIQGESLGSNLITIEAV